VRFIKATKFCTTVIIYEKTEFSNSNRRSIQVGGRRKINNTSISNLKTNPQRRYDGHLYCPRYREIPTNISEKEIEFNSVKKLNTFFFHRLNIIFHPTFACTKFILKYFHENIQSYF